MQSWTRRQALYAGGAAIGLAPFGAKAMGGAGRISSEALEATGQAGQAAVDSGDIPGVVTAILRKGELLRLDTIGLRDAAQNLPMERDTIFAIASMSKPVTVATALTFVDDGTINLSDPITKWAPEFAVMRVLKTPDGALSDSYPAPRAITFEDLMTHRSGLTYPYLARGPLGGALMQKMGFGLESALSPDQWLKELASFPLLSAPGERFNYGHSIDVLGFVIARIGGKPLGEVMRERLFEPAGMTDTGFWVSPEKRARRAATVFSPSPGNFVPGPVPSFTADPPPAFTSGGQGLLSTVDDYSAFAGMLLRAGRAGSTRVLKAESVRLMTSNHMTPEQQQIPSPGVINWNAQGFGYGVMIVEDPEAYAAAGQGAASTGTYGWGGAFGGWWQNDPAQELTILWLQECLPAPPDPGAMAEGRLPRIPGIGASIGFVKTTYAALGP